MKAAKDLFNEALEHPPGQRASFLSEACAGDETLRAMAMRLLDAHESAPGFLASPTGGPMGGHALPVAEGPGSFIGPYELLQQIGEGGFGVVFLAEQREPVWRRVALKVIKLGMDTQEVVSRFEGERQALAMMDHPGIARVLDGGSTARGRPYFVMELVHGEPITTWCDHSTLDIRERLVLFQQVCRAVQHAHQKGIIHRDLKPSNILVTEVDGRPTPKIIDFGIAKAIGAQAHGKDKAYFTDFRQFIGTPEYMSPEQAGNAGPDVDTRSDIYSLGVLLYELLAGAAPFDPRHLRSSTWDEMRRIIREQYPPKPSTLLGTLDHPSSIAACRRTDPLRLCRAIRGDLDWIVMKCLEKDRSRRYETANALAEDLGRHLSGEPVVAAPPARMYRLGKVLRRHRRTVTAGGLVMKLLVAGTVVSTVQWRRAERQAERALAAEVEAERRADELGKLVEFHEQQIGGLDPARMGAGLRRGVLDKRRAALEGAGRSGPELEAGLRGLEDALEGVNFTSLALVALGEEVFARSLEAAEQRLADHPLARAQLLQRLSITLRELGLLDEAKEPQERALAIRRRELGDEDPATLNSLDSAAWLLQEQGRLTEAEAHYREAMDGHRRVLGDDHPDTLTSIHGLGWVLQLQGRLAEAEVYCREAMEGRRRVWGAQHPYTLASINNMGLLLIQQEQPAAAEPYLREALEGHRRAMGEDHGETPVMASNLATALLHQGKFAEAESLLAEVLERTRIIFGDDHPQTLISIHGMGVLLCVQGKYAEAERFIAEGLAESRRVLGDDHPDTLVSILGMGEVLAYQGRHVDAEPLYREALERCSRVLGDEHPDTLRVARGLGKLLLDTSRCRDAADLFEALLPGARLAHDAGSTRWLGDLLSGLGASLASLAEREGAEAAYLEAHELYARSFGETAEGAQYFVARLVELYQAWHADEPGAGHDVQAEGWRALIAVPGDEATQASPDVDEPPSEPIPENHTPGAPTDRHRAVARTQPAGDEE